MEQKERPKVVVVDEKLTPRRVAMIIMSPVVQAMARLTKTSSATAVELGESLVSSSHRGDG